MTTMHIAEAEAIRDFAGLLAHVRRGAEVAIEGESSTIAIVQAPLPPRRTIEECVALQPADSTAFIDESFAHDSRA